MTAFLALCAMAMAADARTLLYVGNSIGDDVSVIDPAIGKVVATIKVGKVVHGVCAPADGRTAYVTVESTHQLQIVDTRTNTVIGTIALPGQPNECAVTSDGHYVAVPLLAPANSVVIYDLKTRALVKTLPLRHPHNCFVPEGGSNTAIWCEERDLFRINRIDLKTMEYTDFVNVGGDPRPFIVMPDEKLLYTALSGLHGVATVDLVKKRETELALPAMPLMNCKVEPSNTPTHGIALTTDRKKLWITSVSGGGIYIQDLATGTVSPMMPTGPCPNWISMSSDGKYAGVSNADSDDTSILDAHTGKELYRIKVGLAPKRVLMIDVPN
ncbi:MAG TPA: YncE family protein [Rhizomicrobium sp.]